jgi:2-(3-amino-3-carboxypropyl)histidine synthase
MTLKTLFIHSRKEESIDKKEIDSLASKLPAKIGLISSIQYLHMLNSLSFELKKRGKKVFVAGQVLGCNAIEAEKIKGKVDAFLLLTSGKFHALPIALKTGKKVYVWHPNAVLEAIDEGEIQNLKGKRKSALIKFLSANKIGILVSLKPGQERLNEAFKLKRDLEKKGKSAYILIADTINLQELENFSVESWVNTACPGIALHSANIINIDEINVLQ